MDYYPLEPDRAGMAEMGNLVLGRVMDFIEGLPDRPASVDTGTPAVSELVRAFLVPPPEGPGDLKTLLDQLDLATDFTLETAGPGFLGYVPGGGLYSSAASIMPAIVTANTNATVLAIAERAASLIQGQAMTADDKEDVNVNA